MDGNGDFYRAILENMTDGVYFCDKDRRITFWNSGAERITGFSAERVIGQACADGILVHVDERGTSLCKEGCPLAATLADGKTREAQAYLHHSEGHRIPVLVRASPVFGPDGGIEGVVETFSENSSFLSALRKVDQLSLETETDRLTGVGNRRAMELKLDACLIECCRLGATAGLLFIDIDHFKDVNDTYGHNVGDHVLKMVAETIKHNMRVTDDFARWGGEEFLALLHHISRKSLANSAEKLRRLVANSFLDIDGTQLRVTISLGATLVKPGDTMETLLARADELLYESKAKGRNRYTLAA